MYGDVARRPPPEHEEVIGEYETVELPYNQVDAVGTTRLKTLAKAGVLNVSEARHGWRITAKAVVGVIDLGSVRLVVRPKIAIAGDRLIDWLCYAQEMIEPHAFHDGHKPWLLSSNGYHSADMIVSALVEECRFLLRDGLRREYVRNSSVEAHVSGRLDLIAQATRAYGRADRFHVSTYRQVAQTWENLVCGLALSRAATLTHDPQLGATALALSARFPKPDNEQPVLDQLRKASYSRLNTRYQSAHAWADVLLQTGGVTDLLHTSGHSARTMLLNMNMLWEKVVCRMAAEAVAPHGGQVISSSKEASIAIRAVGNVSPSHQHPTKPYRPDCLVRCGRGPTTRHVPIDAKYIAYDDQRIEAGNVHQLMTYVSGYCDTDQRAALLVFPSALGSLHREIRVENANRHIGRIHVVGVDVKKQPDVGVRQIRGLLYG
jgi:5-methylcytosine-specific restriction enzyme subunit McrC